jgi:hypothetical protein
MGNGRNGRKLSQKELLCCPEAHTSLEIVPTVSGLTHPITKAARLWYTSLQHSQPLNTRGWCGIHRAVWDACGIGAVSS